MANWGPCLLLTQASGELGPLPFVDPGLVANWGLPFADPGLVTLPRTAWIPKTYRRNFFLFGFPFSSFESKYIYMYPKIHHEQNLWIYQHLERRTPSRWHWSWNAHPAYNHLRSEIAGNRRRKICCPYKDQKNITRSHPKDVAESQWEPTRFR